MSRRDLPVQQGKFSFLPVQIGISGSELALRCRSVDVDLMPGSRTKRLFDR